MEEGRDAGKRIEAGVVAFHIIQTVGWPQLLAFLQDTWQYLRKGGVKPKELATQVDRTSLLLSPKSGVPLLQQNVERARYGGPGTSKCQAKCVSYMCKVDRSTRY
jgi:hypothetical protein